MKRALNHMVAPNLDWAAFLRLAESLDCVGVEFRNDLAGPLFDGAAAEDVGAAAAAAGLAILSLAEVKAFNDWSDARRDEAAALMKTASACGAQMVSLIARNDGRGMAEGERRAELRTALGELAPLLEEYGLVGLIEPLGFETCALRDKREAVEAIEELGLAGRFRIVHDTFHHTLAGGGPIFPEYTGIVHISGVTDPSVSVAGMTDPLRELVDERDRLDNVGQIRALMDVGYTGPVSFEPFAPAVHALSDPADAIRRSFAYVERGLAG